MEYQKKTGKENKFDTKPKEQRRNQQAHSSPLLHGPNKQLFLLCSQSECKSDGFLSTSSRPFPLANPSPTNTQASQPKPAQTRIHNNPPCKNKQQQ
ncbi:hypothetical protein AYI68_g7338 [Smittium mucronatum]|uniref:Uncharacterized protein n=1 Tax=Smittium mucronatum TaxID=133383 RepID=A0A1R0GP08_9FUNG|nr:hypothetical protein AYI68_g7338 [Smittium mucronatum]